MKKILFAVLLALYLLQPASAQVSGNINYQTQVRYPDNTIDLGSPSNSVISVVVKGIANLKADNYVAIFSTTQSGKTAEEANNLMEMRINQVLAELKNKPAVETYVDMISFVPVYEYEADKKIFSKKTYNEVPAGFELKKNIHIRYKDPALLNSMIASLSNAEIYDLVRVDYFSESTEAIKTELSNRSRTILLEKIKSYRQLLGATIDSTERKLIDGYRMVYPVEMYKSYQAYANSGLSLKRSANINQAEKSTTLYYQPVMNKEFDFVINATILEPVIQVLYEIRLDINLEKEIKTPAKTKEFFFVTPQGEIKKMELGN